MEGLEPPHYGFGDRCSAAELHPRSRIQDSNLLPPIYKIGARPNEHIRRDRHCSVVEDNATSANAHVKRHDTEIRCAATVYGRNSAKSVARRPYQERHSGCDVRHSAGRSLRAPATSPGDGTLAWSGHGAAPRLLLRGGVIGGGRRRGRCHCGSGHAIDGVPGHSGDSISRRRHPAERRVSVL